MTYAPGSLVQARGREWVVQPASADDFLVLRPLGGGPDDEAGVLPALEPVTAAAFPPPGRDDLGDASSAGMLRQALRLGFRSSAGPFRSLASLAVEPRSYQLVPLLMALRQETVRLLISDDVGIGKTVEAGLVAAEILAQGDADGLAVLCSPALAEQWQQELRTKFGLDAELVLPSTVTRLQRGLGMGESLFDRYRTTVISTDFIKSPLRRDEFVRAAPDLLIVDEAHTSVSDGSSRGGRSRTQRHELLRRLAGHPGRHLLLVTATPHSGQDEGFRNLLELLDPALRDADLATDAGRRALAGHFVQRRRADIRRYLDEETPFPSDRHTQEQPYSLTPDYRAVFERVLAYARESVTDEAGGSVRQRVRWWSALALLRALASSPAAAAATLRTRAANVTAATLAEADELGRAAVLDLAEDEALEAADATPGALTDAEEDDGSTQRRRLLDLARQADQLGGPTADAKLAKVTDVVRGLLADGFDPIVFCRFIDTAEYVADHLGRVLRNVEVAAVTGTLPPSERVARIGALADTGTRKVLVATDCLSEGVNLQQDFQAVVHYDLAWNPTRHEQREGRVDRFGQPADVVRAVTIYGVDNQIDGVVLDVLLRKHDRIRKATGVSVPVPDDSDSVVEAVLEGLLLRGRDYSGEQLTLEGVADDKRQALDVAWESAADKEKTSRARFAQHAIKPDEVAREVAEVRRALGTGAEVTTFVRDSLAALSATVTDTGAGIAAATGPLPVGLRDSLTPGHHEPLVFHESLPVPRHEALLARTDPDVEAIGRFVLDAALDRAAPSDQRPARRAGVMRTGDVVTRTTMLLLRHRVQLTLPGRAGTRTLVAEDAEVVAFTGSPDQPGWLSDDDVARLLAAHPDANVPPDQAAPLLGRALDSLPALQPELDHRADALAARILDSHRRVRESAGGVLRRGLAVEPVHPADILGVYVYLPVVAGGGR